MTDTELAAALGWQPCDVQTDDERTPRCHGHTTTHPSTPNPYFHPYVKEQFCPAFQDALDAARAGMALAQARTRESLGIHLYDNRNDPTNTGGSTRVRPERNRGGTR